MSSLIDKVILFIISLLVYVHKIDDLYMIIPVLISVFLSSIISYKDNDRVLLSTFIVFFLLSYSEPAFLFFVPLICYDLFSYRIKWLWVMFILPFYANYSSIDMLSNSLIVAYMLVSYVLKYRSTSFENIKKSYYNVYDDAKELSMSFEKRNKELLQKQDYEINLATLSERNRIARDIHDNVGHLLSRCLLQTGALLAINSDEIVGENLVLVKDTLSQAMDSIRSSVHNLHDDSIDLSIEIQELVNKFSFCPIRFEYDINSVPENKVKYAFITITKEALSNVIKHSDASEVSVLLREHPALYQLVIKDNGSNIDYDSKNGIGIRNIENRVNLLGGSINISYNSGFRIFISIPRSLD